MLELLDELVLELRASARLRFAGVALLAVPFAA